MFSTECKVAPLAQTAAKIIDTFDDCDAVAVTSADADERNEASRQCAALLKALNEVEAAARTRTATSFEGALFQLMAIRQAAGLLHSPVEPENSDAALRQINAAINSLVGFLETVGGVDREAVGAEFYLPYSHDRFALRDLARIETTA
jgi:hypothetical protein